MREKAPLIISSILGQLHFHGFHRRKQLWPCLHVKQNMQRLHLQSVKQLVEEYLKGARSSTRKINNDICRQQISYTACKEPSTPWEEQTHRYTISFSQRPCKVENYGAGVLSYSRPSCRHIHQASTSDAFRRLRDKLCMTTLQVCGGDLLELWS